MITFSARLGVTGALAALLLAFGVLLATPAAAQGRGSATVPAGDRIVPSAAPGEAWPGAATPEAPVDVIATKGPSAEKDGSGGGGFARWLMIGSGLLLGLGIGFVLVFLRKGPSSRD
ncbi:hypothetical protein [Thermomonospora umbrina]|nr:hypothetical protein [Thermomonospora umbrina]